MAFKITIAEQKRISSCIEEIRGKRSALISTIEGFNHRMEHLFADVQNALDAYNDEKHVASALMDDICRAQQESFDEKAESWQNSERGATVQSWIDELGSLSERLGYEAEVCPPIEIDIDIDDDAEVLDDMYDEPEKE